MALSKRCQSSVWYEATLKTIWATIRCETAETQSCQSSSPPPLKEVGHPANVRIVPEPETLWMLGGIAPLFLVKRNPLSRQLSKEAS